MLFLFHVLLRPSSGQVLRDSLRELVGCWTHVCGGMVGVVVCQPICFFVGSFVDFFVEGGLKVVRMMGLKLGSAVVSLSQDA